MEAIGQTANGKKRLEDHRSRVDHYTADEVEKADKQISQGNVKLGPRDHTREYAQRTLDSWATESNAPMQELGVPKPELGQRDERPRDAERTQPRVRGAIDVPAEEPAGETRAQEPASSSNGWLGGPTNNDNDNDAKLDIDMDATAQEENGDMDMGFIGSLDATADDVASEMILMAMGPSGRSHLRETRTACRRIGKAMVPEMYSPPRVTEELRRSRKQKQFQHLIPGFALDLTVNDPEDGQPWDFSKSGKGDKALKMVRRDKPLLVIGSPHCAAFPTWQAPMMPRRQILKR